MSAAWPAPSPRVRHGLGRDVLGAVHRIPAHRVPAPGRLQRRTDPCTICAWTGGNMWELMTAAQGNYSELKNPASGPRQTAGWERSTAPSTNWCFVYKKGNAAHIKMWSWASMAATDQPLDLCRSKTPLAPAGTATWPMHPTVKPVPLVVDAILDVSKPGDIVLDAFGGSGTTLVAAHQTERRGRASRSTRFMSTPS